MCKFIPYVHTSRILVKHLQVKPDCVGNFCVTAARLQDFPVEDRPISRVGDHLKESLAEPKATILTLPSSCWQACAP